MRYAKIIVNHMVEINNNAPANDASSMTAIIAILVIVLLAAIAYFAFFRSHSPAIPNTGGQNVEVNTGASSPAPTDSGGDSGGVQYSS